MKYYDELINLETEIIESGGVISLVSAMAIAVNQMTNKDREEALWTLAKLLKLHDQTINTSFYELFDKIRNDEPIKKGNKSGKSNNQI